MPAEELRKWSKYFQARPIGWREDNRTAKLLTVQGVKKSPKELFPSLAAVDSYDSERPEEEAMVSSLKSSVFGMKFAQAMKGKGEENGS